MLEIIYFLLIGVCTGILSGLFGIGGAIITVPSLIFVLELQPVFQTADTMHIAACTSLATMAMTSASSAHAYHRRHALVWPIFWKIVPGLCFGLLFGTALSHLFSNQVLIDLFAIFLTAMGIHLLFDAKRPQSAATTSGIKSEQPIFSVHQQWLLVGGSFIVGNLSALFGIGGGVLLVPLFLQMRCTIYQASGTSALCGIVSALIGVLLLSSLPQPVSQLPHILGNTYWPAALFIGISSAICAPLGTRLAFYLKTPLLKQLFSGVLFISAWCLF
ncbi:MAG: sulfite exporter TauE/SafE family protein [Gammaproteobacteria bacterium]|nr:sulfite exporter TauE/SafE family protein [Gammaproteobacteria bacterium]